MYTSLLSPLAPRRGIRRLLGGGALGLMLLGAAPQAQAQTVYGLSLVGNSLVTTTVTTPGTATVVPITGLGAYTLVGLDTRPATGALFALGYDVSVAFPAANAQLFSISPGAMATAIGSPIGLNLGINIYGVGFDFNPTVDRIRVTAANNKNYRLNPNDGTIVVADSDLQYKATAPADPNAGQDPGVAASAYTNSFIGSQATVLYNLDEENQRLVTQSPPNSGTLNTVATVSVLPMGANTASDNSDFDIYFDPSTRINTTLLAVNSTAGASSGTTLYQLNLADGTTTLAGVTGMANAVRDVAFGINRTAPTITGQLAYGVTTGSNLISFDTGNPSFIRTLVAITGLATGQTLVGTDFRPSNGTLVGLGYNPTTGTANDRLYTINTATGVATAIGTADMDLDLGTDLNIIGFDFNPTVDRIRVEGGTTGKNYRLNPNTGAVTTDLPLNPGIPVVGTVAYTNSFIGSTSTALYALDHTVGTISLQNPPNNGTLTNPRNLEGVNGAGISGAINPINDLDVYYNTGTSSNVPYLAASPTTTGTTSLYTLNALGSNPQTATLVGTIGFGSSVRDISVTLDATATAPTALAAVTGQLLYAIAGPINAAGNTAPGAPGNLISFDSNNPSVIRSSVNFGAGLPATQVIVGMDFRPATGTLYALGYDASIATPANNAQLYTVSLSTGALTTVPSGVTNPSISLSLGTANDRVGFDFNPTVDRIRLVSTTGDNYRLNPNTGAVQSDDTNLSGGTGPFSGTAYTNNQSAANSTLQYVFSSQTGSFNQVTNPNGGVVSGTATSVTGTSTTTGGDFDIFNTPSTTTNVGFIATASSSASANDNLYTITGIGTASPSVSNAGRIGLGSNVMGLSAFIDPATATGLTWNGSVNTDWGTAANWTPAMVPAANSDVTIPSGTPRQPTLSGTQQARVVTVAAGATLTLAAGSTFTVGGNIANSGTVVGQSSGTVVMAGAAVQTTGGTGTTRFRNLTISNAAGVSLAGPVGVAGVLSLATGTLTTTGQMLTILSDATGTGLVAQQGGSMAGSLTVQRFINGSINSGRGYRHFSAPVSGEIISTVATSTSTPTFNTAYNMATLGGQVRPFPTVFGYDERRITPSNGLTGTAMSSPATDLTDFDKGFFSPDATDPMTSGTGFTVNIGANQTPDFTGGLVTSTVAASGLTRGMSPEAGWHFLGNPFAAPYSWDALVTAGGLSNVDNALYVFKSTSQYAGTYAAYVNGMGTNGGVSTLPVAQAYFVRTSAPGQIGTVTMSPANQLTADNGTLFQRGTASGRTQLSLGLHSGTAAIQTAIYFEAGATSAADTRFDAYALPATNGLTLATAVGAEAMAINGLPALTGSDVLVPLHVAAASAGTLTVDALTNLPAGYHAYLRDALTGIYTDLAANTSIRLNLTANTAAAGRYAVLFSTQARALATASAELAQLASVYPNPAHSAATLLLPVALRGTQATAVQVLDNLGRVVMTRTLAAGTTETLELPLGGLTAGVYTVQARTAAGLVAKRLVVQ